MNERISAIWLIQLFIGIFLTASALLFLTNSSGSEIVSGISRLVGRNNTIGVVVAIVELISGIVLLVGLFIGAKPKIMFLVSLVVFILWTINILTSYFFSGFLQPSFIAWIKNLSLYLIVLSGIWGIMLSSK